MEKHIRVPVPEELHRELRHLAFDLGVPLYRLLVDGAEQLVRRHHRERDAREQRGTTAE